MSAAAEDSEVSVRAGDAWTRVPCPELAPFVREYGLRDDRLGAVQIYNPLPARTDCFLQFYLEDLYRVVTVVSGAVHQAPRCVLVGPHTRRREDLLWTGRLRVFTIRFTEVGFRALFGLPAQAIREYAGAADLVLGSAIRELEERLAAAPESDMPAIAEKFLRRQINARKIDVGSRGTARLVRALKRSHGAVPVELLADRYGYSTRQVERLFQEHVGVSPKVFGRLARLRRAIELASHSDSVNWAGVAALAGYFDQSHIVREFQALNGATPVEFRALGRRAARFRQLRTGDVAFVLSGLEPVDIR